MALDPLTNEPITTFQGEIIGSVARQFLTIVGTYLIAQHLILPDVAGQMTVLALPVVVGVLTNIAAFGWSFFNKKKAAQNAQIAATVPAVTAKAVVEQNKV